MLCRYNQPYQYAMYTLGTLCEARRWHISDYEQVLPGITPEQLQVGAPLSKSPSRFCCLSCPCIPYCLGFF